jgi:hypothetical protein
MPSEFEILFPIPTGGRNADDMGMPPVRTAPKIRKPYTYEGHDGLWVCYGSHDWPSASFWLASAYT